LPVLVTMDSLPPLTHIKNAYGDLQTTRPSEFSLDPLQFGRQLAVLRTHGDRGIWVSLPYSTHSSLLSTLAQHGFKPHHWSPSTQELILQCWLREGVENPTPPYAHVDVGCAAIVVNSRGAVLGIREKFDTSGRWNVPGGHLDPGEDLLTCAAREASEEAGVSCVALGVCSWHETHMPWSRPPQHSARGLSDQEKGSDEHALRWGTSHHGVYVLCYATSDTLALDPEEVTDAAWLGREVWIKYPTHVAAIIASAEASGQLAAAAALAAFQGGQSSPSTTTTTLPPPYLISASRLVFPSKHGAPHTHMFYSALPPATFEKAVSGAGLGLPTHIHPAFGKAKPLPGVRLGGALAANFSPPPSSLPSLAITAAVGLGCLAIGVWIGRTGAAASTSTQR
jgi:8-oxo-dGTP pyrophosphatase MutT (NUDIX family)